MVVTVMVWMWCGVVVAVVWCGCGYGVVWCGCGCGHGGSDLDGCFSSGDVDYCV